MQHDSMSMYQHFIVHNIIQTRSIQRAQTTAERQHNRIAEWFLQCKLSMQLWSESTRSIIQWIRISDFGLLDPDGDLDRHQNLIICSLGHALPLQEISSKSVHNFFSYPMTDRQTDRSQNITSFFGGGNYESVIEEYHYFHFLVCSTDFIPH